MGKIFKIYLSGARVFVCENCGCHFALSTDIMSKSFQGRHGKAYLFSKCVNVISGPQEDRVLITGLHTVCDIFCVSCDTLVGWKYEEAYEESQKYKVGKFIIEKAKMTETHEP